jgi:hypothetical protein
MTSSQPIRDLIVVIPGILGSVLEREGKEVWGLSGEAMIGNLLSLGRRLAFVKRCLGSKAR